MTLAPENISFQELVEMNKKQESQISHLESQISQMQFQIDQMSRLLFGTKRERFIRNADEAQLTLPFDVKVEEAPEKEQEVISYVRSKSTH